MNVDNFAGVPQVTQQHPLFQKHRILFREPISEEVRAKLHLTCPIIKKSIKQFASFFGWANNGFSFGMNLFAIPLVCFSVYMLTSTKHKIIGSVLGIFAYLLLKEAKSFKKTAEISKNLDKDINVEALINFCSNPQESIEKLMNAAIHLRKLNKNDPSVHRDRAYKSIVSDIQEYFPFKVELEKKLIKQ